MGDCDNTQRQKLANTVLVACSVLSCIILHMFLSKYSKTAPQVLG